jgi:hypothetical protein
VDPTNQCYCILLNDNLAFIDFGDFEPIDISGSKTGGAPSRHVAETGLGESDKRATGRNSCPRGGKEEREKRITASPASAVQPPSLRATAAHVVPTSVRAASQGEGLSVFVRALQTGRDWAGYLPVGFRPRPSHSTTAASSASDQPPKYLRAAAQSGPSSSRTAV